MRGAWPFLLLFLVGCCRSAPQPPTVEHAGENTAANDASWPFPEDDDMVNTGGREPTPEDGPAPEAPPLPFEPGPPTDTHIATWDCAMPGPGHADRHLMRIQSGTTFVGTVRSGPDATRRCVIDLDHTSGAKVGDLLGLYEVPTLLVFVKILEVYGPRAVAEEVHRFGLPSNRIWDELEVRTLLPTDQERAELASRRK